MERVLPIQKLLSRSQRLPWLIACITLAILAGAILITTQETRRRIREQIVGRDGEILHAVALMHLHKDAAEGDLIGAPEDPGNQLQVALEISRLKGVLGVRLFDLKGKFVEAFPGYVLDATLDPADLALLSDLHPVSRFRPAFPLDQTFFPETNQPATSATEPVLEVNVPLHLKSEGPLIGIAQFIINGESIVQEFARLDRHLLRQALTAFVAGGLLLAAALVWSFRRLNRAHELLAERTEHLVQANKELALAAKTSAVGAVTSHLIHGLRNPLAGLQTFVSGLGSNGATDPDGDVQQAIASARRMQTMISEILTVLREEEGAGQYEVTLTELVEIISGKVQPFCRQNGVELTASVKTAAVLSNRTANLTGLILANLIQNAIEASPKNGIVTLSLTREHEAIACAVRDEGPGFPANRKLFEPCHSTKEGHSGIGLAISRQLANHLGADLELKNTTSHGCVFALVLPRTLWAESPRPVTMTA